MLVSTKHLLESLTQWARREVDDKFVSDAYVKLGNDFRAASRAFTNSGVDISDIGDVPRALRIVLESALSEPPTQESLDRFLPNIRNIIVNLLQTLKAKQIKVKESHEKSPLNSSNSLAKRSEIEEVAGSNTSSGRPPASSSQIDMPPSENHTRVEQRLETLNKSRVNILSNANNTMNESSKDALSQLQKGNVMLRRASKRFSAYQFAKLTNIANTQLPRFNEKEGGGDDRDHAVKPSSNKAPIAEEKDVISVFLKLGEKTKKACLKRPITMPSLRLSFIEKFAYSPNSGIFPDIYVSDPSRNLSYELEEHLLESDVTEGTLLCLEGGLVQQKEGLLVEDSLSKLHDKFDSYFRGLDQRIIELQESSNRSKSPKEESNQKPKHLPILKDLIEIERDIGALRRQQTSRQASLTNILRESLEKIEALKSSSFEENNSSNRIYMETSYAKLSDESDSLLTKVDDLLDMLEGLRKDVAQRGVRVDPKQLRSTNVEISSAKNSLKTLEAFIEKEKPTWKKIWEAELDKVCEEQQFLALQDDLMKDLLEDIKKIEETFDLIERCSTQQTKKGSSKRAEIATRLNALDSAESINGLKDAILSEVSALNPDHKTRLEAIERAERLRNREREFLNLDEFEEELGKFVDQGMLKKSGGVEELEKVRQRKDEENLRNAFGAI